MLTEVVTNYVFSSDPGSGAINVSEDGSQFQIRMEEPISVPVGAQNISLTSEQSTIWHLSPNISAKIGNNILSIVVDSIPYLVEIDDGLYSVELLNDKIQQIFHVNDLPKNLVTFEGDSATGRVLMGFLHADIDVKFDDA